jgi:AcrR family transcriptional regulator
MSQSATSREERRQATSYRISVCAQQLTEQHGLEGFTMEELAEAAGVSRRTLFNYYPSKIDAVLGASP